MRLWGGTGSVYGGSADHRWGGEGVRFFRPNGCIYHGSSRNSIFFEIAVADFFLEASTFFTVTRIFIKGLLNFVLGKFSKKEQKIGFFSFSNFSLAVWAKCTRSDLFL